VVGRERLPYPPLELPASEYVHIESFAFPLDRARSNAFLGILNSEQRRDEENEQKSEKYLFNGTQRGREEQSNEISIEPTDSSSAAYFTFRTLTTTTHQIQTV
jgi:hypothetical protein